MSYTEIEERTVANAIRKTLDGKPSSEFSEEENNAIQELERENVLSEIQQSFDYFEPNLLEYFCMEEAEKALDRINNVTTLKTSAPRQHVLLLLRAIRSALTEAPQDPGEQWQSILTDLINQLEPFPKPTDNQRVGIAILTDTKQHSILQVAISNSRVNASDGLLAACTFEGTWSQFIESLVGSARIAYTLELELECGTWTILPQV